MVERCWRAPWWGGQSPKQAGVFWLDSRQRAWLSRLRATWGDEAVIQIYGGWVRLRADGCDWRFASKDELRTATLRRQRQSQSATY